MGIDARRERRQAFIRTFRTLTGGMSYSPWQVWSDWVLMVAVGISNALPTGHREAREALYQQAAAKYKPGEVEIFAQLFGLLTLNMEAAIAENDYGDFMGELFMELELGNKLGGQFFTPYSVCRMMAETAWTDELAGALERDGWISVNDCACGGGAMLIGFAQACRERGVNFQQDVLFVGQDIDTTTALMCYIQLSLLGCPGYVIIGNTLTEPQTGPVLLGETGERCWYTPMYFSDRWQWRVLMHHLGRATAKTERPEAEEPEPAPTVTLAHGEDGQMKLEF